MTTHTDRDDADHLAEDLAMVRRVATASEPRDYEAGLHADALAERPAPADVRLAYLAGELEGALRELAAFEEAFDSPGYLPYRVRCYLHQTRGEHFRARVRRAADALDAALAKMEEGDSNAK